MTPTHFNKKAEADLSAPTFWENENDVRDQKIQSYLGKSLFESFFYGALGDVQYGFQSGWDNQGVLLDR